MLRKAMERDNDDRNRDQNRDYDLMMIVSDSDLPAYQRSQAAHRVLFRFKSAKDILVWTRAEFDRRVHLAASLPATILREGILLYDHRSTKSQ
jgi:hypothetical protein